MKLLCEPSSLSFSLSLSQAFGVNQEKDGFEGAWLWAVPGHVGRGDGPGVGTVACLPRPPSRKVKLSPTQHPLGYQSIPSPEQPQEGRQGMIILSFQRGGN